jgi:hypothetical protein
MFLRSQKTDATPPTKQSLFNGKLLVIFSTEQVHLCAGFFLAEIYGISV